MANNKLEDKLKKKLTRDFLSLCVYVVLWPVGE